MSLQLCHSSLLALTLVPAILTQSSRAFGACDGRLNRNFEIPEHSSLFCVFHVLQAEAMLRDIGEGLG